MNSVLLPAFFLALLVSRKVVPSMIRSSTFIMAMIICIMAIIIYIMAMIIIIMVMIIYIMAMIIYIMAISSTSWP